MELTLLMLAFIAATLAAAPVVFGMILDAQTMLSDAQAVTSADAYSTNAYDTGDETPARRIGDGEPMCVVFTVDVAAAADGGSFTDTFDFLVVDSPNANLSSHTVIAQRRVAAALLVAGAIIVVPIPPGTNTQRYVGARYEIGTDDTITVSAWIVPQSFVAKLMTYAKGYVVD